MQQGPICTLHNLPKEVVCLSETCKNRLNCEGCIAKHKHKYFLDDSKHTKTLQQISKDILTKLQEYKVYKKANILNLQLIEYRDQLIKRFSEEEIYLQSKITEDTLNFNLQMQRTSETVAGVIAQMRQQTLLAWDKYYAESMKHHNCEQEVEEMVSHFKETSTDVVKGVEESVTFLYSQEMYLKFNLQLDALKSQVAHYQKHTRNVTEWLAQTRNFYKELKLFDSKAFAEWREMYGKKPVIPSFVEAKSEFAVWENRFLSKSQEENSNYKDLLQYKLRYEPLRTVYRLARIDNQKFVSSGSRAVDVWNRVSYHPLRSLQLEYPSYGLLSYVDSDDSSKLLFGLSNGDLYQLDVETFETKKLRQAHMSAIKEIVQYKQNVVLTASQDWLIKIWQKTSPESSPKDFVTLKGTMSGHSGKLNTLELIEDRVISAGTDGTIKLWDVNKLSVEETYDQEREVYALQTIREELFASGGEIREVRLWDYRIPKTPVSKFGIQLFCNTILRIDENKVLLNDKNVLKMIDVRKLSDPVLVYKQEQAFSGSVNHIQYLGDKEIGTGGSDNYIVVWKS